jgi:hypothetical protein
MKVLYMGYAQKGFQEFDFKKARLHHKIIRNAIKATNDSVVEP